MPPKYKISVLDPAHPLYASKLRKSFNREHSLSIGDLVETKDGTVGEFQGISTNHMERERVIVLLYHVNETAGRRPVKLPPTHTYNGRPVIVQPKLEARPELVIPEPGSPNEYERRRLDSSEERSF
ncbi:hypothetical protein ACFLZ7_03730 [Nanoarchaeota archaeon]